MTDQQPTPVDDIIVVGQRRRPGGSFPPASGGGGGGLGEGGVEQDELDPDGQPSGGASDPCANPDTAVPWNADAAAAAAVAAFLQAAAQLGGADAPGGTPSLANREFGVGLASGNPTGIFVYQDGPRSATSANPARPTTVGPEVNPDAQPCA